MKTKIALVFSILTALILQPGCGGGEKTAENAGQSETISVPRMKVTKGSIEDYYEATGTVQARTTTEVSANIMGRIIALPYAEGDAVSKGQILVRLDDSENQTRFRKATAGMNEAQAALAEIERSTEAAQAAVRTAEANRELADKTYARIKQLYERGSATGQEFDEARSRLNAAVSEVERAKASVEAIRSKKRQVEARVEQARADIAGTKVFSGYAKIASPVSGVIVKKFAEQGAVASPGQPILSVEDDSRYRLEAAVEASRSGQVRVGQRVIVRIDSLGQTEIQGAVAEILPAADSASRTFTVKIDLPKTNGLRSGLYGLARFPVAHREALTVPETAIVRRGQLAGLYVVSPEGTAVFRIVTTGETADGQVEILSGLAEGEEIVSADTGKIVDGSRIR